MPHSSEAELLTVAAWAENEICQHDRPDLFQFDMPANHFCFPCNCCVHRDKREDEVCGGCRYFAK